MFCFLSILVDFCCSCFFVKAMICMYWGFLLIPNVDSQGLRVYRIFLDETFFPHGHGRFDKYDS